MGKRDEDGGSGTILDIEVGCLGEIDPSGQTVYERRRISRSISTSDFAEQLRNFLAFGTIDASVLQKKMDARVGNKSSPVDIVKAIAVENGQLVDPKLTCQLLKRFPSLFMAMTDTDNVEAFCFLTQIFSSEVGLP